MKRIITLFIISAFAITSAKATIFNVTNSGFSFSPDEIHVNLGDTVIFTLASTHNVVEVSEATYQNDDSTSNGGFTLPFGGGMLIMLNAGMHYYVCAPHASVGMKGKIEVSSSTEVAEYPGYEFSLYPNPFNEKISITKTGIGDDPIDIIEIYDVSGTTIYRSVSPKPDATSNFIVETAGLRPGLYLIAIMSGDKKIVQRIIKN